MSGASIQVIGSGEAFDSELGNTAYLLRGKGVPGVLFDCGYQVPERLWRTRYHASLDAVFFTHLHADHAFGIVPLLTRYWEEKREKPLALIGGPGLEAYVRRHMELGYPGMLQRLKFELEFLELREGGVLVGVAHHARSALGAVTSEVDRLRERDPRWVSLKPGMVIGV